MGRFSSFVVVLLAVGGCSTQKKETHADVSLPESGTPPAPIEAAAAPGPLSARAAKLVAACKSPPPRECETDADCDTFGIPTFDGPCPSTLRVGIRTSKKAEYLASSPCAGETRTNVPSCVVHWDHAEDDPDPGVAAREIAGRCVKRACVARHERK